MSDRHAGAGVPASHPEQNYRIEVSRPALLGGGGHAELPSRCRERLAVVGPHDGLGQLLPGLRCGRVGAAVHADRAEQFALDEPGEVVVMENPLTYRIRPRALRVIVSADRPADGN